jgi:hypothetical protein
MDLSRTLWSILSFLIVAWIIIWAFHHVPEVQNFIHTFVSSASSG